MLPIMFLIDGIIWYGVFHLYKKDRSRGPYPENNQFDPDMDKLFEATMPFKLCPSNLCEVPENRFYPGMKCRGCDNQTLEKLEDLMIKEEFEDWLERERTRDLELEDYLWREGIINPEETVWVEGIPLTPGNKDDERKFMEIKNQAYLKGMFNDKNLDEGGQDDLYIAWLMLKGCSRYGAEQLLDMGADPWSVNFDI